MRINGFEMAYDDSQAGRGGQGPEHPFANESGIPVLLIHGFPLSRRLWAPQVAGLADIARLLAPDLRGFGESEATPGPYSMELLAADCVALLDALQITQPVVVCGLSMGGYVAFTLYRQYPERVAGLVLTATRSGPDSPEAKVTREQSTALVLREGIGPIIQGMLPRLLSPKTLPAESTGGTKPDIVKQARIIMESATVTGVLGALQGMKDRSDSTPMLNQIRIPVLIVHGADDQIIPIKEAETMRDAIPGARLEVLPEAGHLPNLEQPELFNQAVRRFLISL